MTKAFYPRWGGGGDWKEASATGTACPILLPRPDSNGLPGG